MKKAGILTYYNVHNHGSSLQAYASKRVLEQLGYEVSFLDFERNYDFMPIEQINKYKISAKSIPFYCKYMLEKGISNILYNYKKKRILDTFTRNYLGGGIRYSDFHGDLAYIGSDEVFSTEIGINPFFYGAGLQASKIISYAASFGPTDIKDLELRNATGFIAGAVSKMDAVGVRDNNSKRIIEQIACIHPTLVCDPVILYGYREEQNNYIPRDAGNYILVYSYDKNFNDKEFISEIQKIAKKNNLKIYSVGYHHKWCDKNISTSPFELLGYFKHAKMVVTNTFHGAVLSLITNAQFEVMMSGNKNKLHFLLEEYGLLDRICEKYTELDAKWNIQIMYQNVNRILSEKQKASFEFLKKAIGEEY